MLKPINYKNIEIKQITAKETYVIRHPVLRTNRPLEDCIMFADEYETTYHFGLFYNNQLIAAETFMIDKNDLFSDKYQYRLRGMCVLEEYQQKGLGKLLLRKGEEFLKNIDCDILWFNARINAVKFYETLGYSSVGEQFNIEGIGMHYVMFKKI